MPDSLHILHLGKYYPPVPGGIESLVRDMAIAQVNEGLRVSVQAFHHNNCKKTSFENDHGVHVVRHVRSAGFAKLDYSPELVDLIRTSDADIIQLHVPNPSMILALIKARFMRLSRPIVVTYHSDVVKQKLRAALFRPFERYLYRHVDAICPTSPMYANGSRFLQPYHDRILPVPMGLNLDKFLNPSESDLDTARNLRESCSGPLWLACGRLVYYKGFMTAIAALSQTKTGGELWIIGTGPDKPALEAEAKRLGVASRVRFLGHVASTVPYYHAADAFWFPSNARSEAFGLAQVEAMASGCPIINTNIPNSGVPWVSQHELTGITVPVGNPTALACAADQLALDPLRRQTFANAARERAINEFDIRVMVRRLNTMYESLLGRSHSASHSESSIQQSPVLARS